MTTQILDRLRITSLFAALVIAFWTCSTKEATPEPAEPVKNFFTRLVDIVENNSINRKKINWVDYKTKVWAKVGGAKTVPETEAAMTLALGLLKDNHSTIVVDNKRALYGGIGCTQAPAPIPFSFNRPDIGYVEVKGFNSSGQEAVNFAQAIQNDIARQDNARMAGWIVDLRRNTGGNMYPMIAGLGPLIGEGICGYFYDVDDKQIASFAYKNGGALIGQSNAVQIEKPYQLINSNVKVAVLISGTTASSGEATAIAFMGRSNTRFIGTASCGLTTGNTGYDLPFYGYKLNLFTSNMGDRTGKIYGKEITPDEVVAYDEAVDRAVKWIMQ
ncbi:hypothetical protein GCM10027341_54110 [Spirosoma knui]